MQNITPKSLGYYFPAEFDLHQATWLSWPHKEASWPGKINSIYPSYVEFIKFLSQGEQVCINVCDDNMQKFAEDLITTAGVNKQNIQFFIHPTNDAWCRDHGPAFLINPLAEQKKIIVDWGYNAWGNKYPPYDLDDVIPTKIAQHYNMPVFYPGIVMEGGSVEFNGKGTLLTSTCCLLNENRNPNLTQADIELLLHDYYGVEKILWISEGIVGDDTDGHIDDTVRFVNSDTVLTTIEHNKEDENYELLKKNRNELSKLRVLGDKQLNIIELPMPDPVVYDGVRLPASYANFYIANKHVIVPTFNCKQDDVALNILQQQFKNRVVVGIDSVDIIWGLGSFHCLSQQEPAI
jgi:agmatine deiminase